MPGDYPSNRQPASRRGVNPRSGLSKGAGEFGGLLKQPFRPSGPRGWVDDMMKQPFKPKWERPTVPGRVPSARSLLPLGPLALRAGRSIHPWMRAFDLITTLSDVLAWKEPKPAGWSFPEGWYLECGTTLPPAGACGDYAYGSAPGHTVACGTTSQTFTGSFTPGVTAPFSVTRSRGASGAQFHVGEKHLACMRMRIRIVWRIDGPGADSIIDWNPEDVPGPYVPMPNYNPKIPAWLRDPLAFQPPYPYAPEPTWPNKDRSPDEQHETGEPPLLKPQPPLVPAIETKPGGGVGETEPPVFGKPGARTRERKWKFADERWYQWATWAIGLVTEASDIVEALWKGMPTWMQARYGKASMTSKAKIIYDNWDKLDGSLVMQAFIENQVEDAILGKFGSAIAKSTADAATAGLYTSPKGLQFDAGLAGPPPSGVKAEPTWPERKWQEFWRSF